MIQIIKGKEAVIQKGEIVGLKIRMINSSFEKSQYRFNGLRTSDYFCIHVLQNCRKKHINTNGP